MKIFAHIRYENTCPIHEYDIYRDMKIYDYTNFFIDQVEDPQNKICTKFEAILIWQKPQIKV